MDGRVTNLRHFEMQSACKTAVISHLKIFYDCSSEGVECWAGASKKGLADKLHVSKCYYDRVNCVQDPQ